MADFKWDGFLGDVLTAGAKNIRDKADESAATNNSPVVPSVQGNSGMPPWVWYVAAAAAVLVGFVILKKR